MTKGILKFDEHPESDSDAQQHFAVLLHNKLIFTDVTSDPDAVTQWLSAVERTYRRRLHKLVVGLDVEWHENNPAATLQLCVGRKCLIYQLIHTPHIPDSLIKFLKHENNTFVGVGVDGDLEKLEEDYGFGGKANRMDLRDLTVRKLTQRDFIVSGLKELTSVVLELNKVFEKQPRRLTTSRWDQKWLSFRQIKDASLDAFACFEIGRFLGLGIDCSTFMFIVFILVVFIGLCLVFLF